MCVESGYLKKQTLLANMKKTSLFFVVLFILSTPGISAFSADNYLLEYFSSKAEVLKSRLDLDRIIESSGEKRLVLLGESSHGTAEFYQWRVEITKRLIAEKKFSFVVVEGDWNSIYKLNQYVKNKPDSLDSAREVLLSFDSWPDWMWENNYIENLAEWLRKYNMGLPADEMVGFYGMDVYEQQDAIDSFLGFAQAYFPTYKAQIKHKLDCFTNDNRDQWESDIQHYDYSCQQGLIQVVNWIHELVIKNNNPKDIDFFKAEQNALVIKNAEDFYRLNNSYGDAAWNSRTRHMWLSIKRLLNLHGEKSKGIVWAHNTHVGDVGATTKYFNGVTNIGRLIRHNLGQNNVFIIGFGTDKGWVSAGNSWNADMEKMVFPSAVEGSYEEIFSRIELPSFYLLFDYFDRSNRVLNQYRKHRAIGVVYYPEDEKYNYIPTILPWRYDGFIFIRNTNALEIVK